MNFRLTTVSPTLSKISLGRVTIGWCRKDGDAWAARSEKGQGYGPTALAAFREMVRDSNNRGARKAGYADAREMVEKQNAEVVARVEALNREAGFPIARVRRGRRGILI
jgi:hypothetical protein